MRDEGVVQGNEPFTNLLTQGMVLADTFYREAENGKKTWFNPADIELERDEKGRIISAKYSGDGQEVIIGGQEKCPSRKITVLTHKLLLINTAQIQLVYL